MGGGRGEGGGHSEASGLCGIDGLRRPAVDVLSERVLCLLMLFGARALSVLSGLLVKILLHTKTTRKNSRHARSRFCLSGPRVFAPLEGSALTVDNLCCTDYMDFAKINGSYVMAKGRVNKVPATASEALSSNLMVRIHGTTCRLLSARGTCSAPPRSTLGCVGCRACSRSAG